MKMAVSCKNCNKELMENERPCLVCGCSSRIYKMECEPEKFRVIDGEVSAGIKRGEASWAYFPLAYSILLTITVGIISCADNDAGLKVLALVMVSFLLFYLCFFGPSFRNKIVNLFSKSKEFIEKS